MKKYILTRSTHSNEPRNWTASSSYSLSMEYLKPTDATSPKLEIWKDSGGIYSTRVFPVPVSRLGTIFASYDWIQKASIAESDDFEHMLELAVIESL